MQFYVRVRELERRLVRACGGRSTRDFEYDFAFRSVFADSPLRILDIGGCESLLPLTLARFGHSVTVYDFRGYREHHPNLHSIAGDFLKNTLPSQSFDMVMLISAIEHFGFGSYGAPIAEDADFVAMREVRRILTPEGKVVLTVPYDESEKIIPGFERWYTSQRLARLFSDWVIEDYEYWRRDFKLFGRCLRWLPASAEGAGASYAKYGDSGNACFRLTPKH
jgi:SAM-dependent methyltransferase